ncbi:hypothetical protein VM1G_05744 [Cytospora mali]|uniref:Major facilitator superfamily (MFS) profile domain-containing protein n=1 Tax=Cytospora mali TaxID=578113 RepID=A0A194W296_CYTMA|nr:hypothetical protein VM1G_05744 [Valsa mali]
MSIADLTTPNPTDLPTEGTLYHFVILSPEEAPNHPLENNTEEDPVSTSDSFSANTAVSVAGNGSTAQTMLIAEEPEPEVEKEKLGEEDPGSSWANPKTRAIREREDLSTLPRWRKWALFSCSCLLQFLLQLDMAAIAVTLPTIAKDLRASQVRVFTVATGYFLAQTVFQLVFSHVSHAIGRKYVYLTGVALFLVGAIVAGRSFGSGVLIGGRVIQGIGAAGMFTMSAIIVVEIMQPRQRAAWTAISQASGALGNLCGPLLAGLLLTRLDCTWRSIFFMELFFVGTLFIALLFLLPGWHRGTTHPYQELKHCDWIGILAFFISSVAILIPINIGGAIQKWNSGTVISSLVVGAISLVFLIYHQRYLAKDPAFPREIFTRAVTNIAFLGSLVSGMLLSMVFYNLILFWAGVRHLKTIEVGQMLLSVTLTYTVSAALTGIAIRTCGRIKWATITGSVLSTVGLGLMQLMTEDTPVAGLVLICMCASAGCGIFLPAVINTVIASTDREWHSHAIAMRTLLYTAGQSVGVSTGLAIFTNNFKYQNKKAFRAHGGGIATPQDLMQMIKELPPEVVGFVTTALRWVWGVACVLAFVGGIVACIPACPELPEDRKMGAGVPDEERQHDHEDKVNTRQDSGSLAETLVVGDLDDEK